MIMKIALEIHLPTRLQNGGRDVSRFRVVLTTTRVICLAAIKGAVSTEIFLTDCL
jgi:hypothetical protein